MSSGAADADADADTAVDTFTELELFLSLASSAVIGAGGFASLGVELVDDAGTDAGSNLSIATYVTGGR